MKFIINALIFTLLSTNHAESSPRLDSIQEYERIYEKTLARQTPMKKKFKRNIKTNYKNIIGINPVFLAFGINLVDIRYERTTGDEGIISHVFNPTFYRTTYKLGGDPFLTDEKDGLTVSSLNAWYQLRIYLSRYLTNSEGFYIAPEASIGMIATSRPKETSTYDIETPNTNPNTQSLSFNTGIVVGYQVIFYSKISIDAYFGATRYYVLNNDTRDQLSSAITSLNRNIVLPSWGFTVGYVF